MAPGRLKNLGGPRSPGWRLAEALGRGIEHDRLGQYLKTLGNAGRLEILEQLRVPKAAGEIRLRPRRREGGATRNRPMSRQAVEEHLEVLEAVGVIRRRPSERNGRAVEEFVLHQQRLFAIVAELRQLTALRSASDTDAGATVAEEVASTGLRRGPQLVLAGGPWEGKAFLLEPPQDRWVIGRRRGAHVALDYDPYISQENTMVTRSEEGWRVHDLPRSRNGTRLNFAPLPKGGAAPLRSGDLVAVGRSLLVFRED